MNEETDVAATSIESETPSANDGISFAASESTAVINNIFLNNESDTNDAAKTVDLSIASDEGNNKVEDSKQLSSSESVHTPEVINALGQAPASPSSTKSPETVDSYATTELNRLRREAEEIKAEQFRLEEEIRLAKIKKDELTKVVNAVENEEDHVEIYCNNPDDVMSAITEDHRTLMLQNDMEVLSQITEARTESRYFYNMEKRNRWLFAFAGIFMVLLIAGVVGGVLNNQNGVRGSSNDDPSSTVGESNGGTVVDESNLTTSPEMDGLLGTIIINTSDSDFLTIPPTQASVPINSPSHNTIYTSKVKIQSKNEAILNVYEVQVFDLSGANLAINKSASQSSTFGENHASNAVDGIYDTYSATLKEEKAWWQVDLGQPTPIKNVTIMNRWCYDVSDQAQCLSRLSFSTLSLLDEDERVVATRDIGDTKGLLKLDFSFNAITESISPSIESSSLTHAKAPTYLPTLSPTQTPLQEPSSAPTITDASCSSDEGRLSVFFRFGVDPTKVTWYVVERCTETLVALCNECYQDADPYSYAASHDCIPLQQGYVFYFEDSAGDIWSNDTGFVISFDGNQESKTGDGGSMPSSTMNFGADGVVCLTGLPTTRPTMGPTTHDELPFPYLYPYTRFTTWDNLDESTKAAANYLGYTSYFWDSPNEYELEYVYPFDGLNSTQQQAVNDLEMDANQWDCFMNHYENYYWDLMPDHARDALIALGWVQCSWDKECLMSTPASENSNWRQLNATEKTAAINLCWFKSSWDAHGLPW